MRRLVFVAEQARSAHGLLGRVVAFVMARETWAENRLAIAALAVRPGDRILDIGCAALAESAPEGCIVGVDPSELMAGVARRRNRALTSSGRAEIAIASASHLPFGDATFDRALCVHVVYFWADLGAALKEIARVLKPEGRLALVFRTNANEKTVSAFPLRGLSFSGARRSPRAARSGRSHGEADRRSPPRRRTSPASRDQGNRAGSSSSRLDGCGARSLA